MRYTGSTNFLFWQIIFVQYVLDHYFWGQFPSSNVQLQYKRLFSLFRSRDFRRILLSGFESNLRLYFSTIEKQSERVRITKASCRRAWCSAYFDDGFFHPHHHPKYQHFSRLIISRRHLSQPIACPIFQHIHHCIPTTSLPTPAQNH